MNEEIQTLIEKYKKKCNDIDNFYPETDWEEGFYFSEKSVLENVIADLRKLIK